MRTTRKRAIERARHLTRMGTIEVGDTVEIIENSLNGHDIGSLAKVGRILNPELVRVFGGAHERYAGLSLTHKMTDLKLIKKGEQLT
ncbi:hypothetical protein [Bacteroides graminisolvens]|uniref:hypothetical protein n=1 Tax=Bacteroides graminisolvens TaxID=477666 RepID=UPI00240A7B56|nr:hypothetical protein [Bacteroides graminisolvens]